MEAIPIQWIMDIPPITRCYLLISILLSIFELLGILKLQDCFYSYHLIFEEFQFWRLFFSFFYLGKISINFFIKLYVFSRNSKLIENTFSKRVDYLWFLFIINVFLVLYSNLVKNLVLPSFFLKDILIYYWSRKNPLIEINFFNVIAFTSSYIPFITILFNKLLNERLTFDWKIEFVGIILGHLYFFLNDELPKLSGSRSILTPIWYWFKKENEDENEVEDNEEIEDNQEEQINENQINDGSNDQPNGQANDQSNGQANIQPNNQPDNQPNNQSNNQLNDPNDQDYGQVIDPAAQEIEEIEVIQDNEINNFQLHNNQFELNQRNV